MTRSHTGRTAPPDPKQRRSPVGKVAILICTRGRPDVLTQCLSSLAELELPNGISLAVGVADNNDTSQCADTLALGARLGLDMRCRHQPKRGYSSARNTSLQLAIELGADVAILIDDDSVALPSLVSEHLWALDHYDADAIAGAIDGVHHRVVEGQRMQKSGTGNVSLRRWIYDTAGGVGLRFDPRLDLLGFEDFEFFGDLTRMGGVVVRSGRPRTRDLGHSSTSRSDDPALRLTFAAMEGRNDIVVARLRRGLGTASARVVIRYLPMIAKGVLLYVSSILQTRIGPTTPNAREDGLYQITRGKSAITGLFRHGYERQRAKNGDLVELRQ